MPNLLRYCKVGNIWRGGFNKRRHKAKSGQFKWPNVLLQIRDWHIWSMLRPLHQNLIETPYWNLIIFAIFTILLIECVFNTVTMQIIAELYCTYCALKLSDSEFNTLWISPILKSAIEIKHFTVCYPDRKLWGLEFDLVWCYVCSNLGLFQNETPSCYDLKFVKKHTIFLKLQSLS